MVQKSLDFFGAIHSASDGMGAEPLPRVFLIGGNPIRLEVPLSFLLHHLHKHRSVGGYGFSLPETPDFILIQTLSSTPGFFRWSWAALDWVSTPTS